MSARRRGEGLVLTRKNRVIGLEISLVYLPEEDPSCRWQTECAHGSCVGHETRKLGESFLSVPWEWCDKCRTAHACVQRGEPVPAVTLEDPEDDS